MEDLPLMAATEASGEAKMRRRQPFMASHTSMQLGVCGGTSSESRRRSFAATEPPQALLSVLS